MWIQNKGIKLTHDKRRKANNKLLKEIEMEEKFESTMKEVDCALKKKMKTMNVHSEFHGRIKRYIH